ncbi:hypothetical protein C0Q70_12966 [Pomacea canaliculata]|uniref:Reverse transcriptase domain-containing protein n=1 Tax=Pomacea canaliculata TaxID=400727 RepID=A0A2T7P328_POMCA|nr:hypothetical protein C0Q70_12966 [Pomacea canaliculata]
MVDRLDPLQFAYKPCRGVSDATLALSNAILQHLDTSGTYVRVLFMDFSSAFNTVQPHLLEKRLLDLDVNTGLVLWIRSFLKDRPQRVGLRVPPTGTVGSSSSSEGVNLSVDGMILSDEQILNTGTPKGCVLSPILFSLYTNEITINSAILKLVKYADDMALVGYLKDEQSLSQYLACVGKLEEWFDRSFLELNVEKKRWRWPLEEHTKEEMVQLLSPHQSKSRDNRCRGLLCLGTLVQ